MSSLASPFQMERFNIYEPFLFSTLFSNEFGCFKYLIDFILVHQRPYTNAHMYCHRLKWLLSICLLVVWAKRFLFQERFCLFIVGHSSIALISSSYLFFWNPGQQILFSVVTSSYGKYIDQTGHEPLQTTIYGGCRFTCTGRIQPVFRCVCFRPIVVRPKIDSCAGIFMDNQF